MELKIELLTAADIGAAGKLVELAGWNQLPDDWLRLLHREPEGCFKATTGGRLLGTVTTIRYGTAVAWIGMMLVHPAARRQGIGRQLMRAAIRFLKDRGLQAIGLDATPAGRPLYEQLGFSVSAEWQRWQRQSTTITPHSGQLESVRPQLGHGPTVLPDACYVNLDTRAVGVDRWSWIESLARASQVATSEHGYGLLRPGRLASYLGPMVATDGTQAQHLAQHLLVGSAGPCLWDVPPANPAAEQLAQAFGFQPARTLYRMWLDQPGPAGQAAHVFAISDPATG